MNMKKVFSLFLFLLSLSFSGAAQQVSAPVGGISGHGYLGLGLSDGLKWAACNCLDSERLHGDRYLSVHRPFRTVAGHRRASRLSGRTQSLIVVGTLFVILVLSIVRIVQSNKSPINVSPPDGIVSGYGYVDLGLPSGRKWATCNVGAASPSFYGNYYAWGETVPKSEYTESNSRTYGKAIGDIGGNSCYDAARANWGGPWRLPTVFEFGELVKMCTWKRRKLNGCYGYWVIGPNGKSIFLPAAGARTKRWCLSAGGYGFYWSSSTSGPCRAYRFVAESKRRSFISDLYRDIAAVLPDSVHKEKTGRCNRSHGHPVRAVVG